MTTVHALSEYQILPVGSSPEGYPHQPVPDTFAEVPFLPDYAQRREAFLQHLLRNPAPTNTKAIWHELGRLAAGGVAHPGVFMAAFDFIDARKDCADFVLHGVLRWVYQFNPTKPQFLCGEGVKPIFHPPLIEELHTRAYRTILNFKYFPDEAGNDSLCTWTENHYILYTSAGYLAGQFFPDEIFPNSGESGSQKVVKNRKRILRWLDLRLRSGFSEWLSHVYYDEDLTALLALRDFALDDQIRYKAENVIHLLLLDIALNSFRGVFGSTHGRAYENTKKWAAQEGTTDTAKLLFGMGIFSAFDNMSAVTFALSGYKVPAAIEAIAQDQDRPQMLNRQRVGIRLQEMERWGLTAQNLEDGMHLLTLEAYMHPRTAELVLRMFDRFNCWENSFFTPFKKYRWLIRLLRSTRLLGVLASVLEWDLCRNTREQVDIVTYRTPYYMLSAAVDYRAGFGGDQQHIWQATLAPNAVCFTTHPGNIDGKTPDKWAGSGVLPRVAQVKNVVIAIYHLRWRPALYVPIRHYFTHAWFPKREFDEVVEQGKWIFARKRKAYLALYSHLPTHWQTEGKDKDAELIAAGKDNIWICELGSEIENGSFGDFQKSILAAPLQVRNLAVEYHSPAQGKLAFGWQGPLLQNGKEVDLHPNIRYENPYLSAPFDTSELSIRVNGNKLWIPIP
ncbi:MAG: hypothetical protein Kow0088_14590 [Anaerolineales bacterium]